MDLSSNSFLRDCGGDGPLSLTVVGPADDQRRSILTDQPFAVVGRDPRGGVLLESEQVSLRHAYFQLVGGRILCVDLGSRSGIHMGNRRVPNSWLNPGRFVRVGPYHLACNFSAIPAHPDPYVGVENPLSDKVAGHGKSIGLTADIFAQNVRQSGWRMNRRLSLVGSSSQARLRLRDASVSRFHCSLVATPGGIWVVDLLSQGGIRLNDEPVSAARIAHGDFLQLGCFEIRFRLPGRQQRSLVGLAPQRPVTRFEPPGEVSFPLASVGDYSSEEPSALVPILQQFGLMQRQMQQQMMDQFQNTMMSMMQMFMKMHGEQTDLIRQEMESMRRLTQELTEAKQRMAESTAGHYRDGSFEPAGCPRLVVASNREPGEGATDRMATDPGLLDGTLTRSVSACPP